MNQETNNITKILHEIQQTIQVIGTEKLIEILKISRQNNTELNDDVILKSRMIIQVVCNEFDIDYENFFSRLRKNNRRYAIGITSTLLKKVLKLDTADISYILKKPAHLISIYSREILELSPRHKSDIEILQKIENINIKLKEINYGN